ERSLEESPLSSFRYGIRLAIDRSSGARDGRAMLWTFVAFRDSRRWDRGAVLSRSSGFDSARQCPRANDRSDSGEPAVAGDPSRIPGEKISREPLPTVPVHR